jgi:hypothetical protein
VLFPINPSTLAKYREAFQPSGAKDNPADAELALDLLVRHLSERFLVAFRRQAMGFPASNPRCSVCSGPVWLTACLLAARDIA